MNHLSLMDQSLTPFQYQAIQSACNKVAPTWPLDQSIAVNPYWNMRHQSAAEVAANLSALAKIRSLMPASYYQSQYQAGVINDKHLKKSAHRLGLDSIDTNLSTLEKSLGELSHWHNISDLLDADRENKMAWRDEITHQISQYCAAYFQYDGPLKPIHSEYKTGFYQTWLATIQKDKGVAILMGEPSLNGYFQYLPNDADELFSQAIDELAVEDDILESYMLSLLFEVNGWASWIAFQNFHENNEQHAATLFNFLATRLAWELVLWRYHNHKSPALSRQLKYQWAQEKAVLPRVIDQHRHAQQALWVWQCALEIAYQEQLVGDLKKTAEQNQSLLMSIPRVQAVFCIDVRSEVMRRALESQSDNIHTLGFAGFFGMPIEYAQSSKFLSRTQLPGLIQAPFSVEEEAHDADVHQAKNARMLNRKARFEAWSQQPVSMFSMVESLGLLYGFKLLKSAFNFNGKKKQRAEFASCSHFALKKGHRPITLEEKTSLIANALTGMGLTEGFASTVLIAGHTSEGVNNPHQNSLNCGACGGQSGELNVRVFCQLANDKTVRQSLLSKGIAIPEETRFVPMVHNTTTDELIVQDHSVLTDEVNIWLQNAQVAAQKERAEKLGLSQSDANLSAKIQQRSEDWSQVRPEWGLANNASFFIGPRSLTYQLNLQGRTFLHDYHWRKDLDANVLHSIMTAPMIVTNWINMQYNASVTDNLKFGSGNKVLHNVVGGNIGVFEGNGGDLRIGLSKQSLHDGDKWMHQPLRLSVFIAAPKEAIEKVISQSEEVRDLVNHNWLYILQVCDQTKSVYQYTDQSWQPFLLE